MRVDNCRIKCGKTCCGGGQDDTERAAREFTVALVGQPNTGKSTIFNMITGANQHVGNWPGKTVEKKEGSFTCNGKRIHIYDLPGTYSLTANSLEEVISRDFIIKESPDVVVVVIDASQLRRSLYILAEVVLLDAQVVVALNKMDIAEQSGVSINPDMFEEITGIPTIPLIASKQQGLDKLLTVITTKTDSPVIAKNKPDAAMAFGHIFPEVLEKIYKYYPAAHSPEWLALKLLERDHNIIRMMQSRMEALCWQEVSDLLALVEKGVLIGATMRYDWISDIVGLVSSRTGGMVKHSKFDTIATHPYWGKLTALASLVLGVTVAYLVAIPLMLPGVGLFFLADPIRAEMPAVAQPWLVSMLADGIIGGLAMAIIMLGFIGGVFFVLGVLESTGYLARLAYIFDPFMKKIGLHGKSIMPLLMGLVCNILGVASSRIIDSWHQRLVTLVIAPIVPCKALLVVVAFISTIFFGAKSILVFSLLFIVMLLYIFMTSFFLRKFVLHGEQTGLIMELPPYHKPVWKDIIVYTIAQMKAFYHRGFWFIVLVSFVAWAGIYFPGGSIESSYLAVLGKALEPFGQVMGMDWRLFISYLVAFTSKEATLGAMAVIFGAGVSSATSVNAISIDKALWEVVQGDFGSFLVAADITAASAFAFVFAVFFSLPCLGTLGMIYAETRSLKWATGTVLYYFIMSITMGALAYQAGLFIF